MTTIYLSGATRDERIERFARRSAQWVAEPMPMLFSFAYSNSIDATIAMLNPRRMMLDSGAFTASTQGTLIDISALIDEARNPRWTEVVTLDVIGDWRASAANAARMADELGEARTLPVFHIGEPLELLSDYCARWPKVALGGLVPFYKDRTTIRAFLDRVFARIWPKRVHLFGLVSSPLLKSYPFHSADAATWLYEPTRFQTSVVRGKKIRTPNADPSERIESWVDEMRWRQRSAKQRWARELAQLEAS